MEVIELLIQLLLELLYTLPIDATRTRVMFHPQPSHLQVLALVDFIHQ
jgi:hypothetical protein